MRSLLIQNKLSSTISILIFLSLLPWKIISVLSRKADTGRLLFLVLILFSIAFNSTWILSQVNLFYPIASNVLLLLTAVSLITFTYYYWTQILGYVLKKNEILTLLFHSSVVLYLSTFGTQTTDIYGIDLIVPLYGEIIAFYYVGKLLFFSKTRRDELDKFSKGILFASVITCMMPITIFFFHEFIVQYIAINLSFFIMATFYIQSYIEQSRIESKKLRECLEEEHTNRGDYEELINDLLEKFSTLTPREVEIANLMMIFDTWQEIAEHIGRARSTATKHGSNIYAKFGVHELDDFRELWKHIS